MKLIIIFMIPGLSINKQAHILNGNRKEKGGFNYFYWNCDRGFLGKEKIEDIRLLIQSQNLHIVGISEVDLNITKYSEEEIN